KGHELPWEVRKFKLGGSHKEYSLARLDRVEPGGRARHCRIDLVTEERRHGGGAATIRNNVHVNVERIFNGDDGQLLRTGESRNAHRELAGTLLGGGNEILEAFPSLSGTSQQPCATDVEDAYRTVVLDADRNV